MGIRISRHINRNRWGQNLQVGRVGLLRAGIWVGGLLFVGFVVPLVPVKSGANEVGLVEPDWKLVAPLGGRGATPRAADRSAGGELAVADESGVTWWRGALRERAQIEDVRDIAFDSTGRLWIGAGTGLYAWRLPGRPVRRDLRGGESANRIRRLAIRGDSLLVTSEQGAFWSTSGRIFQPLEGVAANDDYSLGAFRVGVTNEGRSVGSVPHVEAWLLGRLGLIRIHGMQSPTGLRIVEMDRVDLPRPTREASAMDLSISQDGAVLWVAYGDAMASRILSVDQSRPGAPGQGASRWIWLRPVLPPGAAIQRFVSGSGEMLLASDHGLLSADSETGFVRRVASAAGTSNCVDVRADALATIALCREGVFERTSAQRGAAALSVRFAPEEAKEAKAAPLFAASLPQDPPLSEIRRRALKRSGLTVSRAEEMRRGLARRALLPEVSFRFSADVDRDRTRDQDQAFISGDTRYLLDHSRDEGLGLAASVDFEWDLAGLAYPDDSVDLSRELRQVISLRDDIADEINQLYFERQRIRSRLADEARKKGSLMTQEEATALYWRAREIDAGLDAWTGGWLANWRSDRRSREASNLKNHPVQEKGKVR